MKIVPYNRSLKGKFSKLWIEWLRSATGNEPQAEDLAAVDHPEEFYIKKGGAVFFALVEDNPIGVVAVRNLGENDYEFCKLVVIDKFRKMGIGKELVKACITFTETQRGRTLYLQSINQLQVALKMYEKMGFEHSDPPVGMSVLDRTEVIMKLESNKSIDPIRNTPGD